MTTIIMATARELTEVKRRDRRAAPAGQRRGVLVSRAYEGGPEQQHDVVQCCHCQRVWVYRRGSGVRRGWCMGCNGITCGSHACDVCVPFQQLLDNLAAGMDYEAARRHRPVKASVPAAPPKPAPPPTWREAPKPAAKLLLGRA